jgi:hypothetical protein
MLGASCSGSGNDVAISQQPLAGTINGQAWSIGTVTGNWDPYSAFGNEYSFAMVPCGTPASDPLIVLVPGVVGSYPITSPGTSSGETETNTTGSTSTYPSWQPYPSGSGGTIGVASSVVAYFASGLKATRGRVVVSSASTTDIVGGADLTFDTGGHLNGQFQTTTCP